MGTAREQSGVVSWPPDDHSPALDNLHDILNPPGYVGNVHGTWDQRSFIYSTGGGAAGSVGALVLVSFDPGIHLKGIRSFKDLREDIIHKCSAGLDEGAMGFMRASPVFDHWIGVPLREMSRRRPGFRSQK
jgi:hypothetical protein